jgi:large repetitive protein
VEATEGGLETLDVTVADGDGVEPIVNNALSFGQVCAGATINKTALVAIERQSAGGGSVRFANGSTATISVNAASGSGLSATIGSPNTISIPSNWNSLSNGTLSSSVSSTVTFVAGTATGSFSGSVTYRASGTNAGTPTPSSFSLDRTMNVTANVITCAAANTAPTQPGKPSVTAGGNPNNTGLHTLGWTASTDSESNPITYTLERRPVGGSSFSTVATGLSTNSFTFDSTAPEAEGRWEYRVRASDGFLNSPNSDVSDAVTVDKTAPVVTPGDVNDTAWRNTPLSQAFTATDALSGLANAADASFTLEASVESANASTPTTVSRTVSDNAGNATTRSLAALIDLTAPTITATATVNGNPYDGSWTNQDVTVTFSCSDALSGIATGACPAAVVVSSDTVATGQDVSASVSDLAGNSATSVVNVKVDKTAPALVNLPADITAEATSAAGANVNYTDPTATDTIDANPTVSCSPASGGVFPFGTTAVTCTASDASGNSSSASFGVTVEDTTAPELSLPNNITTEATSPDGAAVTFNPTATDVVDGSVTVTCDPASGSTFPLGTTTVECSATDAAGNTANDSFTVTVEDTTAPVLTLPENKTEEATGPGGAAVTFDATATDLVDGTVAPVCTPASGSTFALGDTTVSCTATDAAGNSSAPQTFVVHIVDTTAPILAGLPSNITAEATGPTGAVVSYTSPTATDLVDESVDVACSPASGSSFPVGTTTVNCSATDAAGNVATDGFTVTVVDTTPPMLALPTNIIEEATGPSGASVAYTATASDLVDGNLTPSCTTTSGATFPLGTTTVNCAVSDNAGNEATGSFTVTVVDTTKPTLTLPGDIVAEATSAAGATVSYSASASDLVDGSIAVSCSPASGATFPLGTTTVSCSATDAASNTASGSFTVTVQDTTAPALDNVPDNQTLEATGSSGAVATWSGPTASDLVDGSLTPSCSPASGATFPLGSTNVTCTATDTAGNSASASFSITVRDTTAPTISWQGSINDGSNFYFGSVPAAPTCTAQDIVSGSVSCSVSGYSSAVGPHTLTATATDAAGNTATSTRSYTVLAWTLHGFYQPVTMGSNVYNTVKGGSTVPLKFEVFAGSMELTSTSDVKGFSTAKVACATGIMEDPVETVLLTTGGTSLRYDTKDGQFIQNWQTPKQAGACYRVTMTTQDGSSLIALFKLK